MFAFMRRPVSYSLLSKAPFLAQYEVLCLSVLWEFRTSPFSPPLLSQSYLVCHRLSPLLPRVSWFQVYVLLLLFSNGTCNLNISLQMYSLVCLLACIIAALFLSLPLFTAVGLLAALCRASHYHQGPISRFRVASGNSCNSRSQHNSRECNCRSCHTA
ncbi:hypothetical protein BDR06DRAFT_771525 [Suillus hirtellus]|nr:hypothetical protein BDR06DRAFT_771525 [Suillus hirtellus]